MFEGIMKFFRKIGKKDQEELSSKDTAKERLHLVLMQDRANVSADFLEMMKQEIIEVIKKYIDVDEKDIDVRLTNKTNEDGTTGAPALYANIPIAGIKQEIKDDNEPKTEDKDIKEDKKIDDGEDSENKSREDKIDEDNEIKAEEEQKIKDKNESEENKEIDDKSKNNGEKEDKEANKQVNKKSQTKKSSKSNTTKGNIEKEEKSKEKVNTPKKN